MDTFIAFLGGIAVAVIASRFQRERSREVALSTYLGEMLKLITDGGLKEKPGRSEVHWHARTLTLNVLDQLDGRRKARVFRYLAEQRLIRSPNPLVEIKDANLRGVDFRGMTDIAPVDILGCNLRGSNLSGVTLSGSYLGEVNFEDANLRGSRFANADLQSASMRQADLRDADLRNVDLYAVDLRGARLAGADVTGARLSNTKLSPGQREYFERGGADLTHQK